MRLHTCHRQLPLPITCMQSQIDARIETHNIRALWSTAYLVDDSAGVISHSVGLRLLYLRAEILHCVGTVLYNRWWTISYEIHVCILSVNVRPAFSRAQWHCIQYVIDRRMLNYCWAYAVAARCSSCCCCWVTPGDRLTRSCCTASMTHHRPHVTRAAFRAVASFRDSHASWSVNIFTASGLQFRWINVRECGYMQWSHRNSI